MMKKDEKHRKTDEIIGNPMKNSEKLLKHFAPMSYNFNGCGNCVLWNDVKGCGHTYCCNGHRGSIVRSPSVFGGWDIN